VPELPLPEAASGELRALREANAQLCEALEAKDAQLSARDAELAAARAQIAVLTERLAEVERRLGKDSSNSSKPPSSDSPYTKKPRDRSLRGRSGRGRGKQPGARSSTLKQSDDPDERAECGPAACRCCGAGLEVTEYQVVAKECPGCGAVTEGLAPAGVTGRAS
jgi:transposase